MTSWMKAIERQLEAIENNRRMVNIRHNASLSPEIREFLKLSRIDQAILRRAVPFSWSAETVDAVLAAAAAIPLDAVFNTWNIAEIAAWWWFDSPLPFQTMPNPSNLIHGLSMGWLARRPRQLAISAWIIDEGLILPSQAIALDENTTLGDMLAKIQRRYQLQTSKTSIIGIGEAGFMAASEAILRFIFAGWVWLGQKILVQTPGPVQRQRRKAFVKVTGQPPPIVKVISLRKTVRPPGGPTGETDQEWQCRWIVEGHFRNQACGVGYQDRRLIWVGSYLKGPDDKPLRVTPIKTYVVNK